MTLEEKTELIQGAIGTKQDGKYGSNTADAIIAKLGIQKPQGEPAGRVIEGRGFSVIVDGADLVVKNARCTCFGGTSDPQDSGGTASGISTKPPGTIGVALPRRYVGTNKKLIEALGGSPIPSKLPFRSIVEITFNGHTESGEFIDIGPNLETTKNAQGIPNLIDITVALAKKFKSNASATNFEMLCDYRIRGAAQYL